MMINLKDRALGPWRSKTTTTPERFLFRCIQTKSQLEPGSFDRYFGIHMSFDRMYLMLSRSIDVGSLTGKDDTDDIVAIDPGVRKFATTYSPEGATVIIYGTNTNKVVDKLLDGSIGVRETNQSQRQIKYQEKKNDDVVTYI